MRPAAPVSENAVFEKCGQHFADSIYSIFGKKAGNKLVSKLTKGEINLIEEELADGIRLRDALDDSYAMLKKAMKQAGYEKWTGRAVASLARTRIIAYAQRHLFRDAMAPALKQVWKTKLGIFRQLMEDKAAKYAAELRDGATFMDHIRKCFLESSSFRQFAEKVLHSHSFPPENVEFAHMGTDEKLIKSSLLTRNTELMDQSLRLKVPPEEMLGVEQTLAKGQVSPALERAWRTKIANIRKLMGKAPHLYPSELRTEEAFMNHIRKCFLGSSTFEEFVGKVLYKHGSIPKPVGHAMIDGDRYFEELLHNDKALVDKSISSKNLPGVLRLNLEEAFAGRAADDMVARLKSRETAFALERATLGQSFHELLRGRSRKRGKLKVALAITAAVAIAAAIAAYIAAQDNEPPPVVVPPKSVPKKVE